jgi:flagellar basal-body rod protein FlgB
MLNGLSNTLERSMDLLSARQKVVASNIANADTPGYKTQDIDFQSELRSAVGAFGPETFEVGGLQTKNDGNNVNMDREARLLSENDIRFNLASNLMRAQITAVRAAIQSGSGT